MSADQPSTPHAVTSVGESSPELLIRLNGDLLRVPAGSTLADLLIRLGKEPRTVAIEHNGGIVARQRFGDILLSEGDALEIVHFVQGGASQDGS